MISAELRRGVYALHERGMSERELSRRFALSRNTVRAIIAQRGEIPRIVRKSTAVIDTALLSRLYEECGGHIQRVHERLVEEEKIVVSYPTLTRRIRELGIGAEVRSRCERRGDEPGREMQHDTSSYRIPIGGKVGRVTASLLYLRYSKRRYLRFYRSFTRFQMKCFFHEALTHWGYAARECIIDNTNLARLSGAGSSARMAPEMAAFSRQFGFVFRCHEIGHANRKAGEERSFWTLETNFLPGRIFASLEDLNRQAFEWATGRLEQRAQTKARIVPAVAFEEEKAHLRAVPEGLPAPYLPEKRSIDEYGFIAFEANDYWIPGEERGAVKVLQYAEAIEIYRGRNLCCRYPLPAEGVRGQQFSPEGEPQPRHHPRNRKRPADEEETRLRAMAPEVGTYIDGLVQEGRILRHQFMRKLYGVSRRMSPDLFVRSVARALKYGVRGIDGLERIAHLYLDPGGAALPEVAWDERYREREAYRMGELTDRPDPAGDARDNPEDGDGRDDEDDAQGAALAGTS